MTHQDKFPYGQAIQLLARPVLGNNVVLNQDIATECTLEIFDSEGDLVWTKALSVVADPPTGCLFNSTTTDHTNDPWWPLPDDDGYTFWHNLVPGDLDDNSAPLDLEAGRTYAAKATFATEGGVASWPSLDDYGPVVSIWRLPIASDPSS